MVRQTATARDVIQKMLDAFDRHDPDAYAGLYAADAVVRDPGYPEPLRGREAIRKDMEDFFRAFPDIQCSITTLLSEGDRIAMEGSTTGTHNGPLTGPAGTISPTGRRVSMDCAFFLRLDRDGQVSEENRYFDLIGVMQQLGQT